MFKKDYELSLWKEGTSYQGMECRTSGEQVVGSASKEYFEGFYTSPDLSEEELSGVFSDTENRLSDKFYYKDYSFVYRNHIIFIEDLNKYWRLLWVLKNNNLVYYLVVPDTQKFYLASPIEETEELKLEILAASSMDFPGKAFNIVLNENINGTHTLSFSLPKYYYDVKEDKLKENFLVEKIIPKSWIKLRYGKDSNNNSKWFTFVVEEKVESRENNQIIYNYSCKDLLISELSHSGYNLTFDEGTGMGTIDELGEKIIEGTNWSFIPSAEEDFKEVKIVNSLDSDNNLVTTKQTVSSSKAQYESLLKSVVYRYAYTITDPENQLEEGKTYYDKLNEKEVVYSGLINSAYVFKREDQSSSDELTEQEVKDNIVQNYYIKDSIEYPIWGYKTKKVITSNMVQNMMNNGENFITTDGWSTMSGTSLGSTSSGQSVRLSTFSQDNKQYLAIYSTAFPVDQIYSCFLNNTITSRNVDFEAGQLYMIYLKYVVPEGESNEAIDIGISSSGTYTNFANISPEIKYSSLWEQNTGRGGKKRTIEIYQTFQAKRTTSGYVNFLIPDSYQKDKDTPARLIEKVLIYPVMLKDTNNKQNFIKNVYKTTKNTGNYTSDHSNTYQIKMTYNGGSFSQGGLGSYLNQCVSPFIDEKDYTPVLYEEEQIQTYYKEENQIVYIAPDYNQDFYKIEQTHNKKVRSLIEEKSNRYNLLQSLAELFEGYLYLDIGYDKDGKITSRKLGFKEHIEKNNWNGFYYKKDLNSIERTINSEQIVTKLWVENSESSTSKTGMISIISAEDHPFSSAFLYNFDYFVSNGLLDKNKINERLYGKNGLTKQTKEIKDLYNSLSTATNTLLYDTIQPLLGYRSFLITQIKEKENEMAEKAIYVTPEDSNTPIYEDSAGYIKIYGNIDSTTAYDTQQKYLKEIEDLGKIAVGYYENLKTVCLQLGYRFTSDNGAVILTDISSIEAGEDYETGNSNSWLYIYRNDLKSLEDFKKQEEELLEEFETEYQDYIIDGTWSDDSYTDSDQYYYDAVKVLKDSSVPTVSYSIDVSTFDNDYSVGDKTFIVDPDFFGYQDTSGTPVKEEMIITEVETSIDQLENDKITVQNFRSEFEDLFQRITASVQSLQQNQGIYARANNFTSNGQINVSVLQQTLENNQLLLSSSNSDVIISNDGKGIICRDTNNASRQVRIVGNGIFITKDGGDTWLTGLTADGINASLITTGQLDTNVIRILNGAFPSYIWDSLGISAYQIKSLEDDTPIQTGGLVRFDQHGLYAVGTGSSATGANAFGFDEDMTPWFFSKTKLGLSDSEEITWGKRIEYIQDNSLVSLTWGGLLVKSNDGSVQISTEKNNIEVFNKNKVKRVTLGQKETDSDQYGLFLYNEEGESIFETDNTGNLSITGTINAKSGTIGKIVIDGDGAGSISTPSWSIKGNGYVSFSSGNFTGAINALSGTIGDISIGKDTNGHGFIQSGSSASPDWYIKGDGSVFFSDGEFTGTINAKSGNIGKIELKEDEEGGSITAPNWKITGNGDAYFNNAFINGTLSATRFKYDEIQTASGTILVRPAVKILQIEVLSTTSPSYQITLEESIAGLKENTYFAIQSAEEELSQKYYGFVKSVSTSNGKTIVLIDTLYTVDIESSTDFSKVKDKQDFLSGSGSNIEVFKDGTFVSLGQDKDTSIVINAKDEKVFGYGKAITFYENEENTNPSGGEIYYKKKDRVVLGNLSGVGFADEYGLYSDNVHLTGEISANLEKNQINIYTQQETSVSSGWNSSYTNSYTPFTNETEELKINLTKANFSFILTTKDFYTENTTDEAFSLTIGFRRSASAIYVSSMPRITCTGLKAHSKYGISLTYNEKTDTFIPRIYLLDGYSTENLSASISGMDKSNSDYFGLTLYFSLASDYALNFTLEETLSVETDSVVQTNYGMTVTPKEDNVIFWVNAPSDDARRLSDFYILSDGSTVAKGITCSSLKTNSFNTEKIEVKKFQEVDYRTVITPSYLGLQKTSDEISTTDQNLYVIDIGTTSISGYSIKNKIRLGDIVITFDGNLLEIGTQTTDNNIIFDASTGQVTAKRYMKDTSVG